MISIVHFIFFGFTIKYIRSALDLGFPYMLIDRQRYRVFNKPDADITHVTASVDMPEVLRFVKEKKVRCSLGPLIIRQLGL